MSKDNDVLLAAYPNDGERDAAIAELKRTTPNDVPHQYYEGIPSEGTDARAFYEQHKQNFKNFLDQNPGASILAVVFPGDDNASWTEEKEQARRRAADAAHDVL